MVAPTPHPLEIRLFGGFDARVNGKSLPPLRSRKEQWLLAILALRHERETSREWVSSMLWPDNDAEQALFYLRKALSNLRKALGTEGARLQTPGARTLRLDLSDAYADVVRFDEAVGSADVEALAEAANLYGGALLPDWQDEWVALERGQREQAYFAVLERLAKASDPADAVRWLRLLLAFDPYRESAYRDLMQALADCGDRAAVKVVYRELHTRLHHDLNCAPAPETEALFKMLIEREAMTLASPFTSRNAPAPRRHLPVPLTDLIGRRQEITEVLASLQHHRLVSLVGVGGIGKTRLSIAAAEAAISRFDDGVWFIDLAPISSASLIPQAAKALGIAEERDRPLLDTIQQAITPRQMLIVLDNCEHITDACAEFAFALLSACPGLSMIATSRQPLQVTGEKVVRVHPFPVPPVEFGSDLTVFMEYEAVRLFVDRGARVNDAFQLTSRNASDIVEICRQLDGIALAIEMAAARLRSASVSEIRSRLADRFRLLTSGNRGALPRQQTLRAAIDWSFDHLSEPERVLFRRVSVFAAGWTLEAAEAMLASNEREATLDLLTSLVDKSLIVIETDGESMRYRLLETVRQYAGYRLAEADELQAIRSRHLDFFLALVERTEPDLRSENQLKAQATLELETENVRSALSFCVEAPGRIEHGLRIGRAMWIFWADRGYTREGRNHLETLLSGPDGELSEIRADALNGVGILTFLQSDYPAAQLHLNKALEMSREMEYLKGAGAALNGLGNIAAELADFPAARAHYAESFQIQEKLGNVRGALTAKFNLGRVAAQQGDYPAARTIHEECYEAYQEGGDMLSASRALYYLAITSFCENDFPSAKKLGEESADGARVLGNPQGVADSLNLVGVCASQLGDFMAAKTALEESLAAQRTLGNKWGIATSLVNLGAVVKVTDGAEAARAFIRQGLESFAELGDIRGAAQALDELAGLAGDDHDFAAHLWGATQAMRESSGSVLPPVGIAALEESMSFARDAMGDAAFAASYALGRGMTREQAIAYALQHDLKAPAPLSTA